MGTPDSTSRPRTRNRVFRRLLLATVVLGLVFGLGYWMGHRPEIDVPSGVPVLSEEPHEAQVWTCSMHPQIRQPKPGRCPLCGMDLVPVSENASLEGERRFTVSEASKALMQIQTAAAERRMATHEVRMSGKVDYDETKLAYITAWVPGRIDRLYVDYTGINVRQGDHMVYLYSPDLLLAQDELHRAAQASANINSNAPDVLKKTAEATVKSSREKLRRWGLSDAQVEQAEKKGISSDHVTIFAPIAGTVIERNGQEGMYVDTGTSIYAIADLSSVWVKLDAYESDLPWLRYGQHVTFTTAAYPGVPFEGRISFISPTLDNTTRTVKVRVNVANADGKLKPEMFVRALVRADVSTSGRVMDPSLAGKWICPMHPEIVKDGSASCDVCGMPLVKAETLGYAAVNVSEQDMPLLIPATAPLITGKRAVVYVEVPGAAEPTYEGRQVVLGPRAGDAYVVESGLAEGERVVTNGNFKLDSALQILAKPSMMSSEGADEHEQAPKAMDSEKTEAPGPIEVPAAFRKQLRQMLDASLGISQALASDDHDGAAAAVANTKKALDAVDMKLVEGEAHMTWMRHVSTLSKAIEKMAPAKDLAGIRQALPALTNGMIDVIAAFGIGTGDGDAGAGKPLYRAHCPMAFEGKGADWLQEGPEVRNPYYGAAMLTCGEIVGRLDAETTLKEPSAKAEGS